MRRFIALFATSALFALVGGVVLAAPALAAEMQISQDPYTNPDSQHQTQVEPDVFSFGSTIVAAFQTGRYFDGGASNIGFSTSQDAGASFTPGFLPGTTDKATPPGIYPRVSDPSVTYDRKHNVWIISYLGLFPPTHPNGVDVLVSRSTDGGLTWGNPVAVNVSGAFNDKNWTRCDNTQTSPFFGNCYTAWDSASNGNLALVSTSSDSGLTWGPPKSPASGGFSTLGNQPVVLESGKVVVIYQAFASGQIRAFNSSDGGNTWSATQSVATQTSHSPAGGLRAPALPSAAARQPGPAIVTWSDCRFEAGCAANDIVMTSSTDGVTWTPVARIPIDPVGSGVDHFIPGFTIQPQGTTRSTAPHLALGYYYYPVSNCGGACQLNVGFVFSANGGATWSAPAHLAGPMSLSWLASTNQGRMVGDYMGTAYSGNNAFPVYADASAPVGSLFQEAMFTTQEAASSQIGTFTRASSAGAHNFPRTRSHPPKTAN
jgi:hypothetical protein